MEETSTNRTTKQNEIAFSLYEVGKNDTSNENINSIKGSKQITSNSEKKKWDKVENKKKSGKKNDDKGSKNYWV